MPAVAYLATLILAPLIAAIVARRWAGDQPTVVIVWAIIAALVALPLARMWSHSAALRALAQAHAEHRDILIMRPRYGAGHDLMVCVIFAVVAAAIAQIVLTIARMRQA